MDTMGEARHEARRYEESGDEERPDEEGRHDAQGRYEQGDMKK